jgi:integrase
MARSIRDHKLESRTARLKITPRKEPYWKAIGQGLAIGYYKGAKSGAWYVRYRGERKRYVAETLAQADDVMDSDGTRVLTFYEAQEKARAWHLEQLRAETGNRTSIRHYTVSNALDDYYAWFQHERKSLAYTKGTIEAHIRPHLGAVEIKKLNARKIQEWLHLLATTPPRLRSKAIGGKLAYKEFSNTPEENRKRKATANRIFTVLKAALNHAFREGYALSDEAWRRVKPFHNVDNASRIFLTQEECTRLINACAPDFRKLVQAALLTGCRYSELTNMPCGDFDAEAGKCLVRESKSGKPRHVVLQEEGKQFFIAQTSGRAADTSIFVREDGEAWDKSQQSRRFAEARKQAKIKKRISFHGLRDTHASLLAGNGTPMAVIAAQLGHSDTRVCEKHYAHLTPSYIAETIRKNLPDFGIVAESNIVNLPVAAKSVKAVKTIKERQVSR